MLAAGCRPAAWLAVEVQIQAEGVPGRIEQHPDIVLRLEVRQPRPEREGIGDRRLQVIDGDVQVHHLPLPACPPRQAR